MPQAPSSTPPRSRLGLRLAVGCVLLVVFGVIALAMALSKQSEGLVVVGFLGAGLVVALLIWTISGTLGETQGEIVVARVTPSAVPLGGTLQCLIRYRPRQAFELGDVEIVLEMDEHAIARGGTSDSHYHNRVPADRRLRRTGFRTRPHIEIEFAETLTVPRSAPPTWRGRNNSFTWSVKVHIAVPGIRPDIKHSFPVHVRGELAPEAPGAPTD